MSVYISFLIPAILYVGVFHVYASESEVLVADTLKTQETHDFLSLENANESKKGDPEESTPLRREKRTWSKKGGGGCGSCGRPMSYVMVPVVIKTGKRKGGCSTCRPRPQPSYCHSCQRPQPQPQPCYHCQPQPEPQPQPCYHCQPKPQTCSTCGGGSYSSSSASAHAESYSSGK